MFIEIDIDFDIDICVCFKVLKFDNKSPIQCRKFKILYWFSGYRWHYCHDQILKIKVTDQALQLSRQANIVRAVNTAERTLLMECETETLCGDRLNGDDSQEMARREPDTRLRLM